MRIAVLASACIVPASVAVADYTNNIMITGYWPPTNEMVRQFSTNPAQNPDGWVGENWEGRGYNIHSFFPEFPGGVGANPRGEGDLEVDYQDTSEDFWRIANELKPVAIITFSRGSRNRTWEIESQQRNLETWVPDYDAPTQPTPSPPDGSVPAGHIRPSTLPMDQIAADVGASDVNVFPVIDQNGFGGGFLSEFIAYHGVWYQSIHSSPTDEAWSVAAGHIHVGQLVTVEDGIEATEITLRTLTSYVDSVIPAPSSAMTIGLLGLAASRRRR